MKKLSVKESILKLINKEIKNAELALKSEQKFPSYAESVTECEKLLLHWQEIREIAKQYLPD